jgi:diguanylate cyclase (GGDEF)-like protein/PAS domain S-box-containing protein
MSLIAALIYWVIVALWLAVLAAVCVAYVRNPRTFGAARLLLAVLAIDTTRNIVENLYFGLYFGAQYGLFPGAIVGVLGQPHLLIIPKVINVAAAFGVLCLLLWRWLPTASKERADAERNLDHAERRFGLLVDGVKEYAICLLDPKGHITSWNPGAERIKGYSASEVIGSHVSRFYTDAERSAGLPERSLTIAERDGAFETEALRVRKDKTVFWANVIINAIRDGKGDLIGFAKVTKDVTDAKHAEERLKHLALFDQLTGLPNRTSLFHDLDALLRPTASLRRTPTSVALFDLDGFKEINDTLGHATGDVLLKEVARRFTEAAGDAGRVYRLGGDEFVLVMQGCGNPLLVTDLAMSLMKRLETKFEIDGRNLSVGTSAGIAVANEDGLDATALIAQADLAMYDAKATGGYRTSLFQPTMRAKAQARQEIDTELRRACAEDEFELFFQPQIRLRDGALVGAEALLRWRHPQRGLLAPGAFIDALAQSPVAAKAGHWILRTACEIAAAWHAKGFAPLRIGVNLFQAQLNGGSLVQDVQALLRRTGLPAEALELEITENIALGRDEEILPLLKSLRAMGVGLAFDDFGTGYASLSYLTRYPLTRIKVDRSFVQRIESKPSSEETAIVRSIIAMGHNLGLEVIAEGVETPEQAAFLAVRKCDEVQGYLYAKPLPAHEFERFVEEHRARSAIDCRLAG